MKIFKNEKINTQSIRNGVLIDCHSDALQAIHDSICINLDMIDIEYRLTMLNDVLLDCKCNKLLFANSSIINSNAGLVYASSNPAFVYGLDFDAWYIFNVHFEKLGSITIPIIDL